MLNPCVICVINESILCMNCHKSIYTDCKNSLCNYKKYLQKCDTYPFHMITDNIANQEIEKISDKIIIHVESDSFNKLELIYILLKYYKKNKLLFHCFEGVSKSVTFAISYLSYINQKKL